VRCAGLDEIYKGQEEVDGQDFLTEDVDGERRAFKVRART
jgi:hypothetical protein